MVPAVVGELLPDQPYVGGEADELSLPDELSDEESNEEMDALFVAAVLALRLRCGDSALPIDELGAGVDAADDGTDDELEWDGK